MSDSFDSTFDTVRRESLRRTAGLLLLLSAVGFVSFLALRGADEPKDVASVAVPVADHFGIMAAGYVVDDREVQPNDTFSGLLAPYSVPFETINLAAERAEDVFSVRLIQPGKPLRVYHKEDSLAQAEIVVYEPNPASYVVFDLRDSVAVYQENRPARTALQTASGRIESSLYETLASMGAPPELAVEMSEVFAWQIDFYRLQRGDRFTVAYEQRYVGHVAVGVGRVMAAHFRHSGRDFEAYLYERPEGDEYYDEAGMSLRKAFLVAPVEYSRISSRYSGRRFHPVQKRYKAHLGTDYAAPRGTPIRSTGDGVITEARYGRNNGNYVKVRHNATYTTQYLHMSKIRSGIRPGVSVSQGEVIGYVGSTGLANGNHVCYRFWKNGEQVDHLREDLPSVEPLPIAELEAFGRTRDQWLAFLDGPNERLGPQVASFFP